MLKEEPTWEWVTCRLLSQPQPQTPSSEIVAIIIEKYFPMYRQSSRNNEYLPEFLNVILIKILEGCVNDKQEEEINLLLGAGADPNCTKNIITPNNEAHLHTALQIAVMNNQPSLVAIKLLLDFGADPNWNKTILEPVSSNYKITKSETKLTALHLIATRSVCANDNETLAYEVVKLLLERKADPLLRNAEGHTPLDLRLAHCNQTKQHNLQITQLLHNATFNTSIETPPQENPEDKLEDTNPSSGLDI